MDPTLTSILQVAFGGVAAVVATEFFRSWRAARQGKKEALDKLRDSRNRFRRLFLDWRDHAYHVRAEARAHGVPREKLGDPPQDE